MTQLGNSIRNSKILLTGGFGFIGAHLAQRLSKPKLNNEIVIFDLNVGPDTTGDDLGLAKRKNIRIVQGTILDAQEFNTIGDDFDFIIHAAGFLGIHKVAEQQLLNMDINLLGTRNCLELARRQKHLRKYIQFSTSEIYGVLSTYSNEKDDSVIKTVGKRWTYAASKIAAEYYLKAFVQEYGINAAIVRPFNVYGPHRYGSNAMTALITKALRHEEIQISGDGKQLRAWCHINDFCSGVLELLARPTEPGEAFNIGDDRFCISMHDLAQDIVRLTKSLSTIEILHNDTEDVRERKPDISKAKDALSYEPLQHLHDGIIEVADWVRKIQAAPVEAA